MALARGIDISAYQSEAPDLDGLDFVFVKVTEGTGYVNPKWVRQRAAVKGAGLVFGAYHFARCRNAWRDDADHFLGEINVAPGDLVALDWEPYDEASLGAGALTAWKDAWLDYVKSKLPDNRVGVYCDRAMWQGTDTSGRFGDFLWIADYRQAGTPRIEDPWTFHQYTDTPVDGDVYNGTADELRAWAGGSASPSPPASGRASWERLVEHVRSIPEGIYEGYNSRDGYDNLTKWGEQFGENGVAWCVIFDWCMYSDVGLADIVPKVDNVNAFTAWAKTRGQWSEYPSLGAWVHFGQGAHTEIVVGFTDSTVTTKGGNSKRAGGDGGQGNGVWTHTYQRRDPYIVGYFAPSFDVCPPTADPHDYRAGRVAPPAQEDDMTPEELLAAPMPEYARLAPSPEFPDGYLPTVGECINGSKEAAGARDLAALAEQVASLAEEVKAPIEANLDRLADLVVAKLAQRLEA